MVQVESVSRRELIAEDGCSPGKPSGPRSFWGRSLAIAAAVVYSGSWVFPLCAGLSKDTSSFPTWWGPLDVTIAAVLAVLTLVIVALTEGKSSIRAADLSYRAYRVLIHTILAMCMALIVFGDRIVLANCLTGFAWRTWLLLYMLPMWLTQFGGRR